MPKARFFKFKGLDKKEYKLMLREKLFCHKYLEFKGSGIDAVHEAGYKPRNSKVAASMAYNLLIKVDISAYITFLLDEYGFNDDNVDKQHLYLINQFGDLSAKRGAIDMFYKRFGKYAPQQIKFVDDNEELDDEQIKDEIAKRDLNRKSNEKPGNKAQAKSA